MTPDPAREPAASVIIASVHCRQCGYDLRGLSPRGQCPECGLDIWQTILHTVDPAASRLPKLRNPKAVGDGLVIVLLCGFLSLIALAAGPAIVRFGLGDRLSWSGFGLAIPRDLPLLAGMVAAIGLIGPWKLMPPKGQEIGGPVRRTIWLIAFGLTGWALLAPLPWAARVAAGDDVILTIAQRAQWQLGLAICAMLYFVGLDRALRTIGQRSREYRTARGGRQSVQAMMVAVIAHAVGNVIRWAALAAGASAGWITRGTVIVWTSTLMLVIGLAYMVVNGWWIRRSLRRPPPPMREIIRPGGSEGVTTGRTD